jgi:hypothetical protein
VYGPLQDLDYRSFEFTPAAAGAVVTSVPALEYFITEITAMDAHGNLITSYPSSPTIWADTGGFHPGRVTFQAGLGVFSSYVTEHASGVTIAVSDGVISGSSAPFDVASGLVSGFQWSAMPAMPSTGVPFSVTLTAMDRLSRTITDYAGTATLTAGGASVFSENIMSVSPTSVSGFMNGVASFPLTILTLYSERFRLTAWEKPRDGINVLGRSEDVLDIWYSPLDHFTISKVSGDNPVDGYTMAEIPYAYEGIFFDEDIFGGYDCVKEFNLGWNFPFGGTAYNKLYISCDGRIQFSNPEPVSGKRAESDRGMPLSSVQAIVAWNDDLNVFGGSGCFGKILTMDFPRRVLLEWKAKLDGGSGFLRFEIILYADGRIRFDYAESIGAWGTAENGISNGGTEVKNLTAAFGYAQNFQNRSFLFSPPQNTPEKAGTPFRLIVHAVDFWGNDDPSYTGAVTPLFSDTTGTISPTTFPFIGYGWTSFTSTITASAGGVTISVQDGPITGSYGPFNVNP